MDKEDTVYVYTHSATEKNEIMPFAATQMDIQVVTLCEVSQTEREKQNIAYKWNLKQNTNKLTDKTETYSQTWRKNLWLPEGKGRGKGQLGSLGWTCTHCYI